MKEQLVSLEVAKLLKEKGFFIDYVVHEIYISENEDLSEINNVILKYDEDGYLGTIDDYFNHTEVEPWLHSYMHPYWFAPTQSLAQKYLREKYDIHIGIWKNRLTEKYRIEYIIMYGEDLDVPLDDIEYISYEEALEQGLQKALNLI